MEENQRIHDYYLFDPVYYNWYEKNDTSLLNKTRDVLDRLVEVDKEIVEVIADLNRKKYTTSHSCEGDFNKNRISSPYIRFEPLSMTDDKMMRLFIFATSIDLLSISVGLHSTIITNKEPKKYYDVKISMSSALIKDLLSDPDRFLSRSKKYKKQWIEAMQTITKLL